MFFPNLARRPANYYHNRNGVFYANYRENYIKIAEDCAQRCVYCDISIEEHGGDEMHLDHFRPQDYFSSLSQHPYNLHLACPKCNILKSSDWPCAKVQTAPSFIGGRGYLDRFTHNAINYLRVDSTGHIVAIGGPVNYMIGMLQLNRSSRVNTRRKRILDARRASLINGINRLTLKLEQDANHNKLTSEKIQKIQSLIFEMIKLLKSSYNH
jgi:5-methylcytosine-specific restriction endonuclease McrA